MQIAGKLTQECVLGFTNEYAGMSVPETGDVPWLGLYACILVIGVVAMGLIIRSYRKEQE